MKRILSVLFSASLVLTLTLSATFAKTSPTANGEVVSHSLSEGYDLQFETDSTKFEDVAAKPMGQIEQLNSGTDLVKALDGEKIFGSDGIDLGSYSLLTKVQDLKPFRISDDQRVKFTNVTVTWEVPNLPKNMDALVLHYSTARNVWEINTPSKIDGKKITNTFKDLSPVAVIYKMKDTTGEDTKKPTKTGDNSNVMLYAGIAVVALVGIGVIAFTKRKKEN